MRALFQVSLCCVLATGIGMAQRGGGGGARGGGFGGGMRGGAVGGGMGGYRGGGFTGNRGGFIGGGTGQFGAFGFRGGFRNFGNRFGFGFGRGFYGGFYGGYWPFYGGIGYWPGYYGYGYGYGDYSSYFPGYDYYPYGYGYGSGYATYQPSPNVTVVYPPPVSAERVRPVTRDYDQYGQEIRPSGSPLYLIAFNDHTIRAATTYRIEGDTLHYTTPEKEDRQAPLNSVDRALSAQLNRERRVPFQLPPQ